jgi:hypothetical protein
MGNPSHPNYWFVVCGTTWQKHANYRSVEKFLLVHVGLSWNFQGLYHAIPRKCVMATQHVRTKLCELHAGSCDYVVGKSKQHSSVEATKWTSNTLKRSVAGSCNLWNDWLHFFINFSKGTAKCGMVTWSFLSAPKSRRVETFAYSRVYRKMECLHSNYF